MQVIYSPIRQANFLFGGIESFSETTARNHLNASTRVVQFIPITIDARTSRRTGFPEGSEAFYIQRVRSIEDKPVILDVNVFLKSAMPDLTPEIASGSIYRYLEQDVGMKIITSSRMITAERATPADEKFLDLQPARLFCFL
ncbi:MAG: UTRA domain-containing protein [Bilifractor sp.]